MSHTPDRVQSTERSRVSAWQRLRIPAKVGGFLLLACLFWLFWPLPPGLLDRRPFSSVRILDRNGLLLRELRSAEDGRSVPLASGQIPRQVREAFLAAEDRRFGSHVGVDPLAVGRALRLNLERGRIVSGASTIAQQLARRLLPHPRTLPGKLYEALWAVRLTLHLAPDALLAEYLNRVPLGRSLYGVEAASGYYFGRPAQRLSLGQAALLAGMAASPARFDPFRHPQAARARMREVLRRMVAAGFRSQEEADQAAQTPLDLETAASAFEAPHLLAWLANARDSLGLGDAIVVRTSLDSALQSAVAGSLDAELSGLASRRVHQGAILVVDNASGDVVAYVGSRNFLDEEHFGQNDGVRSLRQPGSALKPFAYGLALASGYTPASVLFDLETRMGGMGVDWLPRNYDRRVHGPVRLRAALANSFNIPAVRLVEALTPERVLGVLRQAGFDALNRSAAYYGAGLVLGNGDVTLWELVRAYRGLALGGELGPLRAVVNATDAHGRTLPLPTELAARRFLPSDAVALLTDILADEKARATAFGLDNALRLPFPVAVKTGTSRAHVDNWCVGFTREFTVGVWVGNFDGTAMEGVSGISGAGPIFKRAMTRVMEQHDPLPLVHPEHFEAVEVCPLSGQRRTEACPAVLLEHFLPGTAPETLCAMHRLRAVDPHTGFPVPCRQAGAVVQRTVELGAGLAAWGRAQGIQDAPSAVPECGEASSEPPRLLSPRSGDHFRLDPTVPRAEQSIPVRIWAPAGTKALEIRVLPQQHSVPVQGAGRSESAVATRTQRLLPPFQTRLVLEPGAWRIELLRPGDHGVLSSTPFRVQR